MTDSIQAIGDQQKVPAIKFNDNRELAMDEVNRANTRLLSLFDTDNFKGFLSPKELEAYAIFKEKEFVEITDENGNKIRDIMALDNDGEYLVNDFLPLPDGRRYRSGIINVKTGHNEVSIFKLNKNGEGTTGYRAYKDGVLIEDVGSEYDEKGNGNVTTTNYEYDENGNLQKTKVLSRDVQAIYDEDNTYKGVKYTDTYEDIMAGQKLDVQF